MQARASTYRGVTYTSQRPCHCACLHNPPSGTSEPYIRHRQLSSRLVQPVHRHVTLSRHSHRHRQAPVQPFAAAAGAATFNGAASARRPSVLPRPADLPPPPKTAGLGDVLPYLTKLALSDPQLYWRLGLSFALMVLSKAAGLMAPVYFKGAVDSLAGQATYAASIAAVTALAWSGACRVVNGLAKEIQHPVFTPVSQAAGRRVAYHTFAHVLGLDITFHLERRTGALSRILERGTRSVAMMFRAVVFTFLPTAVELVLVCAVLARRFQPAVAGLVVATFVAYVGWTATMTKAATEIRRDPDRKSVV